ncbi:metallophosphoesterase [Filomicrobium sp.]|uniref:metallophosphoesterase family protein n=1 Tax=Filomicrobium sp. TaxID=2024831 RepID=UPI00258B738D|nr:metallophosphoesterase [Filomicrobium sp.]MCV0368668.1 metallophosphoesterase [Filomicrobium sp.]
MVRENTVTIAHISDVHLSPIAGFGPRHWNVKRALGYINWHRSRKRVCRADVVADIVADMKAQTPDHIAVTGDLVNVGLPQELAAARLWLENLGSPDAVSVIPGNHDIYVPMRRDEGVQRWADYMSPDSYGAAFSVGDSGFPYVRRIGHVALVGVNSAIPTPVFVAAGRVGQKQRSALGRILDKLRADGLVRVVLIHHPPLPGQASPRRALVDAHEFREVLEQHGAELVLHGHNHRNMRTYADGKRGKIPVIGIASGSYAIAKDVGVLARYNLLRFTRREDVDRIDLVGRGLKKNNGPIVELERTELSSHQIETGASK